MANKLILHTDRISEEQLAQVDQLLNKIVPADVEVVQYNHNMEVNWRDINKYAECKTVADMKAVNPNYGSDVTSDWEWVYPLPKLESAGSVFHNNNYIRKFKGYCPKVYDAEFFLSVASNLEELHVEWNTTWRISSIASSCPKLHTVSGFCKSADIAYNSFSGASSLRNYSLAVPNLRRASGFLNKAILTKESVIFLCNSIPTRISESVYDITIGIHIDHKYDSEVNLALKKVDINYTPTVELPEEVTTGKGWTLTVQWNGTPTSQAAVTYGLRKPPIYAKVSEHELPDSTTERVLDWGHYVTNWEERGYEEFRSVEEAIEYFGLPAEDENVKPD